MAACPGASPRRRRPHAQCRRLAAAQAAGLSVEYLVDPLGRRVGRRTKTAGQWTGYTGWLYQDQLNPVAELDGQGHVTSRFVYATRGHVPDYMLRYDTSGSVAGVYRYVHDHLGSVVLVVDVATGAVKEKYGYDPWGVVTSATVAGGWSPQPFGFAGGLVDRDTGLVRFGARDYDPEVGRWTGRDPIGFAAGDTNLWGYVGSDPVNFVDPSGLYPCRANPGYVAAGGPTRRRAFAVGGAIGVGAVVVGAALYYGAVGSAGLINTSAGAAAVSSGVATASAAARNPGLQTQIVRHWDKVLNYWANPLLHDNRGFLAQALKEGNIQRYNHIYRERINSLLRQIANFRKQL